MPDARPGARATTADVPGLGATSDGVAGVGSENDARARISGGAGAVAEFVVAFRSTYFARSGETYVPHLDDFNAPSFSPTTTEDDVIAGTTLSEVDPTDGAVTVYLGTFEDAADSVVSLPVPAGTVAAIQVRASAAPGAGKSFSYTLMRNGVASSMSVTVSDSSQSGVTSVNPVSCSVGDRVSLRLVADSGASAAHHRFTLRYSVNT